MKANSMMGCIGKRTTSRLKENVLFPLHNSWKGTSGGEWSCRSEFSRVSPQWTRAGVFAVCSTGRGLEKSRLIFKLPPLRVRVWMRWPSEVFANINDSILNDFKLLHEIKEKSHSVQYISVEKTNPLLERRYSCIINRNCSFSINDW